MLFSSIIKLFDKGNVCVCGLRGTGKDMLFANVAIRRGKPYVSNVDYGGHYNKFIPEQLNCNNDYKSFIENKITQYHYPFPDETDFYISDVGVYFPSHYCAQLNKDYGYIPTFMALSRHLGDCNIHFNVQNLNRAWDKLREQSDLYIMCNKCIVLFGHIVIQTITLYELYESAVKRVPPFRLKRPLINPERKYQWEIQKTNYDISYGSVERKLLIYRNKSTYNTRIFKEMLENGTKET